MRPPCDALELPYFKTTEIQERLAQVHRLEIAAEVARQTWRTEQVALEEAIEEAVPRPLDEVLRTEGYPELLRSAVDWHTQGEQPDNASMSHLGLYASLGLFRLGFIQGEWPIATFELPILKVELGSGRHNLVLFTEEEVAGIKAMVGEVAPVIEHWNGAGTVTLSVRMEAAPGPGVRKILDAQKRRVDLGHGDSALKPEGWN